MPFNIFNSVHLHAQALKRFKRCLQRFSHQRTWDWLCKTEPHLSLPWILFSRKPLNYLFHKDDVRNRGVTKQQVLMKYWLMSLLSETELKDTSAEKHTSWCKVEQIFWGGYGILILKLSQKSSNFVNFTDYKFSLWPHFLLQTSRQPLISSPQFSYFAPSDGTLDGTKNCTPWSPSNVFLLTQSGVLCFWSTSWVPRFWQHQSFVS